MDVKSNFPNGVLEEKVYTEQPLGYKVKGHEEKVLKFKKVVLQIKASIKNLVDSIITSKKIASLNVSINPPHLLNSKMETF